MFPQWFNNWNCKDPTNIYGPAIIIGAVGGAVFVAALPVAFGQHYATTERYLVPGPAGRRPNDGLVC